MTGGKSLNSTEGSRVLIVDDEEPLRRAFSRMLNAAGYRTRTVPSGEDAIAALREGDVDVVLSDISMQGMNGTELLRQVRTHDLDLPVVLMTGAPSLETAVEAVELGALRYLVKPIRSEDLIEAVGTAAKLGRIARLKREAASYLGTDDKQLGDRAGLEASFDRALSSLWMAYQPLVHAGARGVAAFEALVRADEPTIPHPGALLAAAERLERIHELGRVIRASVATTLRDRSPESDIFINLHPQELLDDALYSLDSPIAPYAEKIVFEITERVALDEASGIAQRIARLRSLGYRIAVDDLGAGYAGLNYFALLAPDVVKLDMSLVRGVDSEPVKQKLIRSISSLCRELGMQVVAEGIETSAERDAAVTLGCDLLQGYLFARPGRPFPSVE